MAILAPPPHKSNGLHNFPCTLFRRCSALPFPFLVPTAMINNWGVRRILTRKGRVITASLEACRVYSPPIPFSGMDLLTLFVFSAIAFIAHEVTKNVYSMTPILHCNANVVWNSRFHVYSSYHPKAAAMIWMPQLIPKTWRGRYWWSPPSSAKAEVPNWMARILHPNLWILMGDLSTRTRVFTITIVAMDIAATVVLNWSPFRI